MNELQIMKNKELRNKLAERYEVLDKVKNLILMPDKETASVKQIADYYEVGEEAIQSLYKDNKAELDEDGVFIKKPKDFSNVPEVQLKTQRGFSILNFNNNNMIITNRGLKVFSIKAILRIGMLLTESEVAENVRKELYKYDPELYFELSKSNQIRFKKYEKEIKNYLEFSFGENNVKYQVKLNRYSLDFVLYDKLHIEIDENGHTGYDKEKELERQLYINKNTDYITIRHNPNKEMPFELIEKIIKYKDYFSENK